MNSLCLDQKYASQKSHENQDWHRIACPTLALQVMVDPEATGQRFPEPAGGGSFAGDDNSRAMIPVSH